MPIGVVLHLDVDAHKLMIAQRVNIVSMHLSMQLLRTAHELDKFSYKGQLRRMTDSELHTKGHIFRHNSFNGLQYDYLIAGIILKKNHILGCSYFFKNKSLHFKNIRVGHIC